ncbi:hypothetical protein NLB33_29515 [Mycolicibacterium smegmatis]|uniref:hypothetical protein n=1 Tax=Mycolicibacterium smegmatis TaxID=1772 RepID=UPI0020A4E775|nr:hypothetical protein [Mycolicibacterium smegmatis]MCP2626986.1 hypothetical protein [Mycolicibacterium smegmatis]
MIRSKLMRALVVGAGAVAVPMSVAVIGAAPASAGPNLCVSGPYGYAYACVEGPGWVRPWVDPGPGWRGHGPGPGKGHWKHHH